MNRIIIIFLLVAVARGSLAAQTVARDAQIATGEYFTGVDPGTGRGIPIAVSNPSTNVTLGIYDLSLQANATVYIRFRNSNGLWSTPRAITFPGTGVNRDALVMYAEYFVGSDPGRGKATSISITQGPKPSLNLSSVSLQSGQRVYFRIKDAESRWSFPVAFAYPARFIRRAEIIIGSNPSSTPFGTGIAMTARDGAFNSAHEPLSATITTWNRRDTIWVRAQSSDHLWSYPVGDIALYNAVSSYSSKIISFGTVRVGAFKDTVITISNTGKDTLKITSITSSNAIFSARPTSKTVPSAQFFADTLRFAPSSVGTSSAFIIVSSNALSSPDTIRVSGNATLTEVDQFVDEIPKEFSLAQNYPNPFNPATTIEFSLPRSELATLKIFNLLGEEVATLVNEVRPAGTYRIGWNASGSPSGVYIYRLQAGDFTATKKLILLR